MYIYMIVLAMLITIFSSISQHRQIMKMYESEKPSTASTVLTYEKDIKPIFKERCIQCHNGQSSLPNWMDYDTAYQKRLSIKTRVWETRTMPLGFITEEERKSIRDWVDQGAKR